MYDCITSWKYHMKFHRKRKKMYKINKNISEYIEIRLTKIFENTTPTQRFLLFYCTIYRPLLRMHSFETSTHTRQTKQAPFTLHNILFPKSLGAFYMLLWIWSNILKLHVTSYRCIDFTFMYSIFCMLKDKLPEMGLKYMYKINEYFKCIERKISEFNPPRF